MSDVCVDNDMSYKDINLSINCSKESQYNTIKLMELYGVYEDTLKSIILDRSNNYNVQPYTEIIDIYDNAVKLKDVDIELHDALITTCYFKIYKELSSNGDTREELIDTSKDDKGKERCKLNFNKLRDHLIRKYCIISYKGIPYLYIDKQYFIDDNKSRLKKDIEKILANIGFSDYVKIGDISKDIIERIITHTQKMRKYPFNELSSNLIPVNNGVIYRKTKTLLPNSPVFKILYHLNVEYDPNVKTKNISKYLDSLVEVKEDAELLIQIPAQALLQNEFNQLAYLLTGDGKNGKSTYITFLQRFIGKDNYTCASLQDLTENRFAKADLVGKLLNLYPDLNKSAVKYLGTLKALTGSDEIKAERKFGQPFDFVNKAVLCFSANELPEVQESTYAFWRRWCVIPFPHKFESDQYFMEKITTKENMSEFLNLVVDKMDRIEKFGLSKSKRVDEAAEMWKARSSSAYYFVSKCIDRDTTSTISRDDLMNLYLIFCEDNDITPQDIKVVTSELQKIGVTTSRTRDGSKFVHIYKGCKYNINKKNEGVEIVQSVLKEDGENNENVS